MGGSSIGCYVVYSLVGNDINIGKLLAEDIMKSGANKLLKINQWIKLIL